MGFAKAENGVSTRLPPMWPGFDSGLNTIFEFVRSSLCSESFFSGFSDSPLSPKTKAAFHII